MNNEGNYSAVHKGCHIHSLVKKEIVKDRPVNVAGLLHIRNNFIHTPCTTVWMVDPILYPGTILLQMFYVDDLEYI